MIILLHVLIALSSLVFTTYLYLKPSKTKFYASYTLIGATLASGTYLVISSSAPLLSSCTTGLTYLSIVTFANLLAHRKFKLAKKAGY